MDIITKEELKTFLARYPGWYVSLFMPTHRRGRETEQDPIRFRNLLREVEERLLDKGLRSPDVQEILKPAQRLLQEPGFWRHQSTLWDVVDWQDNESGLLMDMRWPDELVPFIEVDPTRFEILDPGARM